MSLQQTYPYSNVKMLSGDILYSSIGKSTNYVGRSVIIGPNYNIIESLPGKPSGHTLTPYQYWHRHNQGDKITLLLLFHAEDGIRDRNVTGVRRVLFR